MAYSEAQKRASMKYNKAAYDRVELRLPKGQKKQVEARAKSLGKSLNGYISGLIDEDMRQAPEAPAE